MSIKNFSKVAIVLALTGAVSVGLTACSTPTPTPTNSSTVIAPIVKNLSDLTAGTTVNMKVGEVLDINTGDTDPAIVMVQDTDATDNPNDKVVVFSAGGVSGTAVNNPSYKAVGAGTAYIVLVNDTTGAVLADFTIVVS